jgi:PIN domain nuclease of toxin-antitoxin system
MSVPRYVFDACAVIAFLAGEDGADKVKGLLGEAAKGRAEVRMHRINLLEVYYDAYKVGGLEQASRIYQQMLGLPIIVDDGLDDESFRKAGEMKATNRISLADAIALSFAIKLDAMLVTSDHHEFDVIEAAGHASFEWIR